MEDTNAGSPVTSVEPQVQPEQQETEVQATEQPAAPAAPDQPEKPYNDPEKLAKALDRKNRAIGKKTAELYAARRRIQELEQSSSAQSQQPQAAPTSLKPENFSTVEAYFEAVAESKAEAKIKEYQSKNEAVAKNRVTSEYRQKKFADIDAKAEVLKDNIPDFEQVISENGEEIREASPHVHDAILESDDGALVTYYIAKEGLFEKLNAMTPARAAYEIARIESEAKSSVSTKPISKTPAPMQPVKGSATGSKSLNNMSGQELLKWMRS